MSQLTGTLNALTFPSPISVLDNAFETYMDKPKYYLIYAEGGAIAVQSSRVMKMEVTAEGKVVAAPIAENSFASYNKVPSPMTITAQLAVEGQSYQLQNVVETLKKLKETTTILDFVTPIYTFLDFTLEKFSYEQTIENGVNVLYIDIGLVEIREVTAQYSDAKAPAPITQKKAKDPANVSTQDKGNQQEKPKNQSMAKELKIKEKLKKITPDFVKGWLKW